MTERVSGKEYIEREKALSAVQDGGDNNGWWGDEAVSDIADKIKAIPAADVAPIVRCIDCEYGCLPKSDGIFVWCKPLNTSVPFDFYCANGLKMGKEASC